MSQSEQSAEAVVDLTQALADLKENEALEIVRLRLGRGDDPLQIIEDCQAGMREVGERYAQRRYYLSGLIMAGDILREITELVLPLVEERFAGHTAGRVLLGTVQGDIHDLGKNLLMMLLRSYGFTVLDLGVDVAPGKFVAGGARVQASRHRHVRSDHRRLPHDARDGHRVADHDGRGWRADHDPARRPGG